MNKPTLSHKFPADKAEWNAVVELLEVLAGRRGNKIEVPALTTLTFSATPTQAEVQALYDYVNRQRAAIASILDRLQD